MKKDTEDAVLEGFFAALYEVQDIKLVSDKLLEFNSGIHRNTIHKHFGTIEGIPKLFFKNVLKRLTEAADRTATAEQQIRHSLKLLLDYKEKLLLLHKTNLLYILKELATDIFTNNEDIKKLDTYESLSLHWNAAGKGNILLHWLENGMPEDAIDEMVAFHLELVKPEQHSFFMQQLFNTFLKK